MGSDGHSKTWMDLKYILGFPGGSAGKDSACSAGDLCPIPGSGRFPGEGHGNPFHSSILAWKIPWTEEPEGYSPWGHKESDTTKQLSLSFGGKIDKTLQK